MTSQRLNELISWKETFLKMLTTSLILSEDSRSAVVSKLDQIQKEIDSLPEVVK